MRFMVTIRWNDGRVETRPIVADDAPSAWDLAEELVGADGIIDRYIIVKGKR